MLVQIYTRNLNTTNMTCIYLLRVRENTFTISNKHNTIQQRLWYKQSHVNALI